MYARKYRMTEAALLTLETAFYVRLRMLYECSDMWSTLPRNDKCYSVRFRALAFRLMSRAGCVVEQLLCHAHRGFPYRMFALLADPTLRHELTQTPACLLDSWSKSMMDAHPDLSGPEFMCKLELQATLQGTDISAIESRHASLRRAAFERSCQTKTLLTTSLSAEWLCQQLRVQRRGFLQLGKTKKVEDQQVPLCHCAIVGWVLLDMLCRYAYAMQLQLSWRPVAMTQMP